MLKPALRLIGLLSVLGCAAPAIAQIVVSEPWVRGTVEGQTSTGAYMTISSAHDVTLIGAASDAAAHVDIHEMRTHGEMMMMRRVEHLAIPAGHPVALDAGHYHVMLDGLKRSLNVGDEVGLELQFVGADGAKQTVRVMAHVRELAAHDAQHMHSSMGHE